MVRRLRDAAHALRDSYKTIVVVSPLQQIAPELGKDVTVLEYGLPGVPDFNRLLDRIVEDVRESSKIKIDLDADGRERLATGDGPAATAVARRKLELDHPEE